MARPFLFEGYPKRFHHFAIAQNPRQMRFSESEISDFHGFISGRPDFLPADHDLVPEGPVPASRIPRRNRIRIGFGEPGNAYFPGLMRRL
ncbi:MAG: hypothetical protein ACKV2V_21450 [Blastocatellia bacterium]